MIAKSFLAAGVLLASGPAMAQVAPAELSSDELVCQLSGACGEADQLEASQDKPDSRGFKIARKVAGSPAVTENTAGKARLAKVTPETTKPAIAGKPGRNRTYAATKPRGAVGRANLGMTFDTGSAELTDAGRQRVEKFLTALAAPSLAGKTFRIEGHTDAVGSRERNLELSKLRAQSVVDYLAAKGADRSRFSVVGYGPDKPLPGAATGANRRVEIVLVK